MVGAGECDNIASELAEAQGTSAELSKERDELAAALANLEAEHANLGDAHTSLRYTASSVSVTPSDVINCMYYTDPTTTSFKEPDMNTICFNRS